MNPTDSLNADVNAASTATAEFTVSQYIAVLNQVLEVSLGGVVVVGELANLRVSKNRWIYFDLKDEESVISCFGTVYQLPGPLEDGMLLRVRGTPRHHNLYGFKINVQSIAPAGEGSIKKAAQLLQAQLAKEGLFDEHRKRLLPPVPHRVALVTSLQSAAYADFIKIINARWQGLEIEVIDVQVQGEAAPAQIAMAIEQFNSHSDLSEVLVLIRGGGSAEDLAAFSTEQVTRAVAASRIPTLVAIGHEVDLSLAELAADKRASTPSNAAELLVPDKKSVRSHLKQQLSSLQSYAGSAILGGRQRNKSIADTLANSLDQKIRTSSHFLDSNKELLRALNPGNVLNRGYAIVRYQGRAIKTPIGVKTGSRLDITLARGQLKARTISDKE